MSQTLTIRGHYANHTFTPDEPLPDTVGVAELVIILDTPKRKGSIADAFGKAPILRTTDDILNQIQEERSEWGDR